jgi:DNA-binding LacI/PurR family transcriptional regulator
MARLSEPPLTTVSQPTEQKGELAAQSLLRELESEEGRGNEAAPAEGLDRDPTDLPPRTILPAKLVVRGTTAPAPG